MENITPTHITLILAIVGAIFWLARIESKTNTHSKDIDEIYEHVDDREIHHDGAELDRRFSVIDSGMRDIKKGVDRLVERFDNFLSK